MSKKILFWIILIVGICWVSGVGYWFIGNIENLDLGNIKWKENFTSEDIETQDFFRGILLIIVPFIILALALLFYSIGLFFGNKSKEIYYKVEEENENLKSELAQQINKVETMKIIYTGGKIEKKRGKEFLDKIEEKQVVERIQEKNKSEIKKDDLKVIEGIGERIEFFLNESEIYTWEQLSQSTEEYLKNILLIYGGISYKIHDPSTWQEQANLASQGRWDELTVLKEKIKNRLA